MALLIEGHIPAFETVLTEPYFLRAGAIERRSPDMEHKELAFPHPFPSDGTMRYSAPGNLCVFHAEGPNFRESFRHTRGEGGPAREQICHSSVTKFVNWIH